MGSPEQLTEGVGAFKDHVGVVFAGDADAAVQLDGFAGGDDLPPPQEGSAGPFGDDRSGVTESTSNPTSYAGEKLAGMPF